MKAYALYALLVLAVTVHCQPSEGRTEELQLMLRQSMEQNERLEQQLSRMKLVWTGLGQMCQTLAQPECLHEEKPESVSPKPDKVSTTSATTSVPIDKSILKVFSLESTGNKSNTVSLTVTYTADENHVTDWFVIYNKYETQEFIRTGGKTVSHGLQNFSSTVTVTSLDYLRGTTLNIYSGTENTYSGNDYIVVTYFVDDIMKENKTILPDYDYASALISTTFTYIAPKTGDMNIALTINGTVQEWSDERKIVSFGTMNISVSPPTMYGVLVFNSDLIDVSLNKRTNDTSTMVVTLDETLLDAGGLLDIRLPIKPINNEKSIMAHLFQGHLFDILSADYGEILPPNSVALYPMKNVTVVMPLTSLNCVARGNPVPDVQLYRVLKNGRRKRLKTEIIIVKNITAAMYKLRAENRKTTGQYICRATSGTAVVEDFSHVRVYKPVTFDETMTGVIKNSTGEIVFGCKVWWTLKPDLEFSMSNRYDQVIKEDESKKISVVQTGKGTSQITLTVSPPDEQLCPVFCVSRVDEIVEYREIELFPGMDPN